MFGLFGIGIGIAAILFGLLARAVGKMNIRTGEAEVSGSLSLGAGSHAGKRAVFIGKCECTPESSSSVWGAAS